MTMKGMQLTPAWSSKRPGSICQCKTAAIRIRDRWCHTIITLWRVWWWSTHTTPDELEKEYPKLQMWDHDPDQTMVMKPYQAIMHTSPLITRLNNQCIDIKHERDIPWHNRAKPNKTQPWRRHRCSQQKTIRTARGACIRPGWRIWNEMMVF